jgi:hypothetical protein
VDEKSRSNATRVTTDNRDSPSLYYRCANEDRTPIRIGMIEIHLRTSATADRGPGPYQDGSRNGPNFFLD